MQLDLPLADQLLAQIIKRPIMAFDMRDSIRAATQAGSKEAIAFFLQKCPTSKLLSDEKI
jgi:hypothetical protein